MKHELNQSSDSEMTQVTELVDNHIETYNYHPQTPPSLFLHTPKLLEMKTMPEMRNTPDGINGRIDIEKVY